MKSTDSGLYRLIITSPTAKVEGPEIAVGVYRPVKQTITAKPGQEVVMKVYAWGPDLIWQWSDDDSAFIRGSRTDTLRVLTPERRPSVWRPSLQMRDASAEPAHFTITLSEVPAPPSIDWQGNWTLGDSVEGARVDSNAENPQYLVSGLPPGVRLNAKTGALTGAPNRVGTYRIEWRVRAGGLTSLALVTYLYVDKTIISSGLYAGPIPANEHMPQGGFATLSMTTSGAYSVKLQIGARIYRIAGSIGGEVFERYHSLPPFLGTTKTTLRIADATFMQLFFELGAGSSADASFVLQPIEASGVQSTALPRSLLFTQPLIPTAVGITPVADHGSGFATIRMTGARTANLVGTLPDGTGITASGPVVSTTYSDYPTGDSLLVYFCPAASTNWVMGDIDLHSLRSGYPDDSTADLIWGYKDPANAPDFDHIQLKGRGAPYFPPAPGMLLIPALMDTGNVIRLSFSGGGLPQAVVSQGQMSRSHKALFASPNTSRTKLDFHTPTGFFTGSIDVAVPMRKTLTFRGLIVPYLSEGHGIFSNRAEDGKVRTGKVYQDVTWILEP
ncbi:MAG: hypothetical protein NTV80_12580 [Verrucomicrobia bacterium]|nr:hypothetical protein [Verrucomicrobiota bacterium]